MRALTSKNVNSTCAVWIPRSRSSSSYVRYSRPWPTALAACRSSTAAGRAPRPSRCIPRAIAPLVTTTTSTPLRCSAATSSTIRATTDNRSSPESSATIEEPSLTTATGMAWPRLGGVQLEHHAPELDVVTRFEPLRLQRGDHAHAPQPVLDVRERLVVLEVMARDQAVDGGARDAVLAVAGALDLERAARGRAEDLELGDVVLPRVLGHRLRRPPP